MTKRKEMESADRKKRIIEAAFQQFAEHGAAFARLNEIAKKAKVSPPLIHYYFPEVEDLHLAVIQRAIDDLLEYNLSEAEKHADDPVRMMKEYLKGPLLWAKERPKQLSLWIYFYYMASQSKRFEELHTFFRKRGRERISLMIFRGLEAGVFTLPQGVSVEEMAYQVQAQITGQLIMYACEEKADSLDKVWKQFELSIMALLQVKNKTLKK